MYYNANLSDCWPTGVRTEDIGDWPTGILKTNTSAFLGVQTQVRKLLRAIYRPQNFICIHIDAKSRPTFRKAIETMVRCLDNVFLSSRSVKVKWGEFSVLEPELICMEDLLKYKGRNNFILFIN